MSYWLVNAYRWLENKVGGGVYVIVKINGMKQAFTNIPEIKEPSPNSRGEITGQDKQFGPACALRHQELSVHYMWIYTHFCVWAENSCSNYAENIGRRRTIQWYLGQRVNLLTKFSANEDFFSLFFGLG